ncbi:MAG TPA: hypothetical protein VKN62_13360 [Pelovirga sp.]|nr:hypothetical protein [Pelovirga sp.]
MARTSNQRRLAVISGLIYGIFYLYAIGDLNLIGPPVWDAYLAELSLERIFRARSMLMFEAVAVLETGYLIWLISPLNLLITGLLSGLFMANVDGALALRRQVRSCTVSRGGLFAGALPALLAGGACCAPSLLLLLGIPALGALSAFFGWLVPLSLLALGLNRIWQKRQGAPPVLAKNQAFETD